MSVFKPVYIKTHQSRWLKEKIEKAHAVLNDCRLCPRDCKVNRLAAETGICRTGEKASVSSFNPHFGEETPLVGTKGSGTIFFTHCNLLCSFCQNYDISHEGYGEEVSDTQLAEIMLSLQNTGCHNINFVTPTHVVPQILSALEKAIDMGLSVPLVYNSGGYDKPSTLKLLDGVFDIYMPDFKFWNPDVAQKTCQAADYPQTARRALIEMHRQVGDLTTDASGIAMRGLLVRHLVLPAAMAGTRDVAGFIATNLSSNTYINIMSQYRPCGRASEIKALSVPLSVSEYNNAVALAREEGLNRLDKRERIIFLKR